LWDFVSIIFSWFRLFEKEADGWQVSAVIVLFFRVFVQVQPISDATEGEVTRRSGMAFAHVKTTVIYLYYIKPDGAIHCSYFVWSVFYFSILSLSHHPRFKYAPESNRWLWHIPGCNANDDSTTFSAWCNNTSTTTTLTIGDEVMKRGRDDPS
jgi:hypothetical protein